MRTVANIQVLRAVAALVVLWAHLRELFPDNPLVRQLPSGLAGVDLFFVISGFIMVVSTSRTPPRPGDFLAKRFSRVAPLYYAMTLLIFAVTLLAPTLMKSSTSDPLALLSSLAFIPFFKSPDRIYPTYYLGWTLNYEMLFYLLFAVGILIRREWRIAITSALVLTLVIVGAVWDETLRGNAAAYAWTRPIMIDFVFGMAIGAAVPWMARVRLPGGALYALLAFGAIAIAVAGRLFPAPVDPNPIAPATSTVLRYGIPAAIIVFSAVALEQAGHRWTNRFLQTMGDASYSLYLTHFLVVAVVISLSNRLALSLPMRLVVSVPAVLACLVVAYLCFRFVETPLNALVRRLMFGRAATPAGPPPAAG